MHYSIRIAINSHIPTVPGGARRVFVNQADIACTKGDGPNALRVQCWSQRARSGR